MSDFRAYSWVLAGKCGLVAANAVLMLFLVRRLPLETYGLFMTAISAQLLISRILILGVDSGVVRLSGTPELRARAPEVASAGLLVIFVTTGALLLAGALVGPVLASWGVPFWMCAAVAAGAGGTALVDYAYALRLSRHRYATAAFVQSGTALARFAVTLAAVVLSSGVPLIFAAYHATSLASGLGQLSSARVRQVLSVDRALVRRLIEYSRWPAKSNILAILALHQGAFLLTMIGDHAGAGVFGLGLTISLGFLAVYHASVEYLCVRLRSVDCAASLTPLLARAVATTMIVVVACVPAIVIVGRGLAWMLPVELSSAVTTFYCLAAAMMLLVLQAPLEAASHALLRPQWITYGSVVRAVSIGGAGLLLAPGIGAVGMAIAQVAGTFIALMTLAAVVAFGLREAVRREPMAAIRRPEATPQIRLRGREPV